MMHPNRQLHYTGSPITADEQAVADYLSDGTERSFAAIESAISVKAWELTVALAKLAVGELVSSRVDLSTGRHVRLYRATI